MFICKYGTTEYFSILTEQIKKYGLEKECYYTFENASVIYPALNEIDDFLKVKESIKPEKLDLMKQIIYPREKKLFKYDMSFTDWFFCPDRISQLEEIPYEEYILNAQNYDYKHLYVQSYVSFSEIMNYFFYERKQFEYYNGIPRLQQIASKHNVISIKSIDKPCIDIDSEYDYYLLRLCPEYIEEIYGEVTWRDDHYVLLGNFNDSRWTYINDNPRDCRALDRSEMLTAYAGSLIRIDLINGITDKIKNILLQEFLDSMSENKKVCSTFSVDNIIAARNALAVLRILRRRIYEYCSQYICCDFMVDYLNELEKQFI